MAAETATTVTVAPDNTNATLAINPLVLTLKSTPPPSGSIDFQKVEVWEIDGPRVAEVALEAAATPVPIPTAGDYQIRTVRPLPGYLQPPDGAGPKVRLSNTSPAKDATLPERTAKLQLAFKVGTKDAYRGRQRNIHQGAGHTWRGACKQCSADHDAAPPRSTHLHGD